MKVKKPEAPSDQPSAGVLGPARQQLVGLAEEWNSIAEQYSDIRESRRDSVFVFVRDQLKSSAPRRLLDFGGGDGGFAASCAELGIPEVVVYDPAPMMAKLAAKNCSGLPNTRIVTSLDKVEKGTFDVVTLHAIWMCLPTYESCIAVLSDVAMLLNERGRLIASVTHPCFRTSKFSTYQTDFDMRDYLKEGSRFQVRIFDGQREIRLVDTHWSLGAMTAQLKQTEFLVEEITELPDLGPTDEPVVGSPWLVLFARKRSDG
jgi:spermidine synthase